MHEIEQNFGYEFTDDWQEWSLGEMGAIKNALTDARDTMGTNAFKAVFNGTKIRRFNRMANPGECGSAACAGSKQILMFKDQFGGGYDLKQTLLHEMGHVWDIQSGWGLSKAMTDRTGSGTYECVVQVCGNYNVAPGTTLYTQQWYGWNRSYAGDSSREDFAMAFQLWVQKDERLRLFTYSTEQFYVRKNYFEEKTKELNR